MPARKLVPAGLHDKSDRIVETEWGYIVRKGPKARRRAAMGEMAALAGCIMFGAAAFLQWLAPGVKVSPEMFPFRVGATVFLFGLAMVMYFLARNGLGQEVQFDTTRGLVLVVRRNFQGEPSLVGSYQFSEISSLFAKRNKAPFRPDHLYLQPRGRADAVHVTCGPTGELAELLERIRADFQERADMAAAAMERKLAAQARRQAHKRSAFAAE